MCREAADVAYHKYIHTYICREAADAGISCAMNNLGVMYALGRGISKDGMYAYMYVCMCVYIG